MPLPRESLPVSTDYDPVEDAPGSIDPLGTLAYGELLADVMFPGFTARMFRPRLLTMAVAALHNDTGHHGRGDRGDHLFRGKLVQE